MANGNNPTTAAKGKNTQQPFTFVGLEEGIKQPETREFYCKPSSLLRGWNYRELQGEKVEYYYKTMKRNGFNDDFPIIAKVVHKETPFDAIGENGEVGQLPPGDYLEIISGNHRHEAAMRVAKEQPNFLVRVRVTKALKQQELSRLAYLSNTIAQHSPVEEGQLFWVTMQQNKWDYKQLADYFSQPQTYIKERVLLVSEASQKLLQAVVEGKISKTTALALIKTTKNEPVPEVSQDTALAALTTAQEHKETAQENLETIQTGLLNAIGEYVPVGDLEAISQGEKPLAARGLSEDLTNIITENVQAKRVAQELEHESKSVSPSEAKEKALAEYGEEVLGLWALCEEELTSKGALDSKGEPISEIPYVAFLKPAGPYWHLYPKDLQDQLVEFFKIPRTVFPPQQEPRGELNKKGLTPEQIKKAMQDEDKDALDPYWKSHPEMYNLLQIMEQHLKLAKSSKQNLEKLFNHVDKGKSGMIKAAAIYGILNYFEAPGFKDIL